MLINYSKYDSIRGPLVHRSVGIASAFWPTIRATFAAYTVLKVLNELIEQSHIFFHGEAQVGDEIFVDVDERIRMRRMQSQTRDFRVYPFRHLPNRSRRIAEKKKDRVIHS